MIDWSDEFLTGFDEIDKQHKLLFKFFNILEIELQHKSSEEVVTKAIDFMEEYVHSHFGFEEACMCGVNCPEAENNKRAHQYFIERLKEYRANINNAQDKNKLITEMHQFIEDWFVKHILAIDTQLKQCRDTYTQKSLPDAK